MPKVKKIKTYKWDPAEHIKTEKDVIAYLNAALEDGDPKLIAHMLGNIARSQGMAAVAKKSGLGRESLYKALSKGGNPKIETLIKVVHALGLKLQVAA